MSRINGHKLKAQFQGEQVEVTIQQQVMSTALAIEALEKLLIDRGVIDAGDIEKGVAELIAGKKAGAARLVQLAGDDYDPRHD